MPLQELLVKSANKKNRLYRQSTHVVRNVKSDLVSVCALQTQTIKDLFLKGVKRVGLMPSTVEETPRTSSIENENSASDLHDRSIETKAIDESRKKPAIDRKSQEVKYPDPFDIDSQYRNEPQFASIYAKEIYEHLRKQEKKRLRGDGKCIQPAIDYPTFKQERMNTINWFFNLGHKITVSSETIHMAIFYFDRFYEKYEGPRPPLLTVAVTALFMASKYNDIDPIEVNSVLLQLSLTKRATFKEIDVYKMEMKFLTLLETFEAPTTTSFAHRYLQSVGMELNIAAVDTVRYLCALAVSCYEWTGEYYSKLAAAAAFISYNKYSCVMTGKENVIDFPGSFEYHCRYSLKELKPIVLKLVELAIKVENKMNGRSLYWDRSDFLPVEIYAFYSKKGITTGKAFPDFEKFFKETVPEEEEGSSAQKRSPECEASIEKTRSSDSVASSKSRSTTH